jgi:hypothetical protein
LETELNLDPESDPELITDPDPNLQIISDPAGSGCTTLFLRRHFFTTSNIKNSNLLRSKFINNQEQYEGYLANSLTLMFPYVLLYSAAKDFSVKQTPYWLLAKHTFP